MKSNKFIDEAEVYKIVFGKLNLPLDSLDILEPMEMYWIWQGREEAQRERLYLESFSVFYAIRSANSPKVKKYDNPFADKEQNVKAKLITQEEKDNTLSALEEIFN